MVKECIKDCPNITDPLGDLMFGIAFPSAGIRAEELERWLSASYDCPGPITKVMTAERGCSITTQETITTCPIEGTSLAPKLQ